MIQQLTVKELEQRLASDADRPMILDVREPWELDRCQLPDSKTIPMREIPTRLAELPKDAEIAVLCHHGTRSQRVAEFLLSQGYENLHNVVGGIDAWAKEIDPAMVKY